MSIRKRLRQSRFAALEAYWTCPGRLPAFLADRVRNAAKAFRRQPAGFVVDCDPRYLYRLNEYLFQLLFFLSDGGDCDVVYRCPLSFHNYLQISDPKRDFGRWIFRLPRVRVASNIGGDNRSQAILITDKPDRYDPADWRKVVTICFDSLRTCRAMQSPDKTDLFVPYPMWTRVYMSGEHRKLDTLRQAPRTMRMFFAGGQGLKDYHRDQFIDIIPDRMLRPECLDALVASNDPRLQIVDTADAMPSNRPQSGDTRFFFLRGGRIDVERWLSTLATADFFLCQPGIVMPMCHNIIEAMAVGTIPVTNYPEWLYPRLEDGENCLVYDTPASLQRCVDRALSMSEDEVRRMRSRVVEYYNRFLTPQAFVSRLRETPGARLMMYMNTERARLDT